MKVDIAGFMDDDYGRFRNLKDSELRSALDSKDFGLLNGTDRKVFKVRPNLEKSILSNVLVKQALFGNPLLSMESWPFQSFNFWGAFFDEGSSPLVPLIKSGYLKLNQRYGSLAETLEQLKEQDASRFLLDSEKYSSLRAKLVSLDSYLTNEGVETARVRPASPIFGTNYRRWVSDWFEREKNNLRKKMVISKRDSQKLENIIRTLEAIEANFLIEEKTGRQALKHSIAKLGGDLDTDYARKLIQVSYDAYFQTLCQQEYSSEDGLEICNVIAPPSDCYAEYEEAHKIEKLIADPQIKLNPSIKYSTWIGDFADPQSELSQVKANYLFCRDEAMKGAIELPDLIDARNRYRSVVRERVGQDIFVGSMVSGFVTSAINSLVDLSGFPQLKVVSGWICSVAQGSTSFLSRRVQILTQHLKTDMLPSNQRSLSLTKDIAIRRMRREAFSGWNWNEPS